ncbi:hypothetical protein HHI36_015348 [Cryptolaemus montrouzieri]|uniref:Uncharacterized protein n=1 Tax=Cryptolaemus montrouzieri TaxID=559131 RepID=A0ABD2N5S9_9CUCU
MNLEDENADNLKGKAHRLRTSKMEAFWDGLKKYLKSYCEVSSIQGLNYMVKDGVSWFERLSLHQLLDIVEGDDFYESNTKIYILTLLIKIQQNLKKTAMFQTKKLAI